MARWRRSFDESCSSTYQLLPVFVSALFVSLVFFSAADADNVRVSIILNVVINLR